MPPFGEKRLIGSAPREIAAEGHRAERAAVITLTAGNNAIPAGLTGFEKILARKLDGSFGRFGTSGSRIDAAVLEIGGSEIEKTSGQPFGGRIVKLRSVDECKLRGLRGHRGGDFRNTVADIDDRRRTRRVKISAPIRGEEPGSLAAHGEGEVFSKITREKS